MCIVGRVVLHWWPICVALLLATVAVLVTCSIVVPISAILSPPPPLPPSNPPALGLAEKEPSSEVPPAPRGDDTAPPDTVSLATVLEIVAGASLVLLGIVGGVHVLRGKGALRWGPCRRLIAFETTARYSFEYSKVSCGTRVLIITRLHDNTTDSFRLIPYYWNISHEHQVLFATAFKDSTCIRLVGDENRLKREMTFYEYIDHGPPFHEYINNHMPDYKYIPQKPVPQHQINIVFRSDDHDEFRTDPPNKLPIQAGGDKTDATRTIVDRDKDASDSSNSNEHQENEPTPDTALESLHPDSQ